MDIAGGQIVRLFAKDPNAIHHRRQIADVLSYPVGLYPPQDFKYLCGHSPVDELFNEILKFWVSSNGVNATVQNLVELLTVNTSFTNLSGHLIALVQGGDANTPIIYNDNTLYNPPSNSRIQFVSLENNKFVVLAHELLSKLNSVPSHKIILLSVNGPARKGKSVRMNQFLKYFSLRSQKDPTDQHNPLNATGWLDQPLRRLFPCGGGDTRVTSGIYVWDEIIKISQDGDEIAVILLDCQGLYDRDTIQELDTKLFAFSLLLSSVFIYLDNKLSSDVLDSINMFATISDSIQPQRGSKMLQKFIYVCRDFQGTDYKHGYHDKDRVPWNSLPHQNFQHHLLQQNTALATTMEKITDNFSTYLMPIPKKLPLKAWDSPSDWDAEFRDSIVGLVEQAVGLDATQNCFKKLGDEVMTGSGLKTYIELLITLFRDDSKFPEPGQLAELNAKWHAKILGEFLLNIYKTGMKTFLSTHEDGVEESELTACSALVSKDCSTEYAKKFKPMYKNILEEEFKTFRETRDKLLLHYKEDNRNRVIQTAARVDLLRNADLSSEQRVRHDANSGAYMKEAERHQVAADLGERLLKETQARSVTQAEKRVMDAKVSLERCEEELKCIVNDKDKFVVPSKIFFNSHHNSTSVEKTEFKNGQYGLVLAAAEGSVEQAKSVLRAAERELQNLQD